jgi:hypothetical protein
MPEKTLDSGSWNGPTSASYQGGQLMHYQITNVNILGTTITIDSNLGGTQSSIILPTQTVDFKFTCFGSEPMGWTFNISTASDVFLVTWQLSSTWVPGDPPNPPVSVNPDPDPNPAPDPSPDPTPDPAPSPDPGTGDDAS